MASSTQARAKLSSPPGLAGIVALAASQSPHSYVYAQTATAAAALQLQLASGQPLQGRLNTAASGEHLAEASERQASDPCSTLALDASQRITAQDIHDRRPLLQALAEQSMSPLGQPLAKQSLSNAPDATVPPGLSGNPATGMRPPLLGAPPALAVQESLGTVPMAGQAPAQVSSPVRISEAAKVAWVLQEKHKMVLHQQAVPPAPTPTGQSNAEPATQPGPAAPAQAASDNDFTIRAAYGRGSGLGLGLAAQAPSASGSKLISHPILDLLEEEEEREAVAASVSQPVESALMQAAHQTVSEGPTCADFVHDPWLISHASIGIDDRALVQDDSSLVHAHSSRSATGAEDSRSAVKTAALESPFRSCDTALPSATAVSLPMSRCVLCYLQPLLCELYFSAACLARYLPKSRLCLLLMRI